MPIGRKPPDLDEDGNVIVPGVTKNSLPKAKVAKPPDLDDEGQPIVAKSGLLDKVGSFLNEHPRLREVGERFLTGTSPENEEMLKNAGVTRTLGTPQSEASILPRWESQPETYAGGFLKSIYNDF